MASINLQGDTSGSISISAPSVAGSNTLTLPATTQTLATQNSLGVRNLIINGDMRIAQRGTSFTSNLDNAYTLDRWKIHDRLCTSRSVTQESFSTGSVSTFGKEVSNYLRATFSNDSGATPPFIMQAIEDVKSVAGETVTISFWAKADSAQDIELHYSQQFGGGGSSEVTAIIDTFTLTTSWVKYTTTVTIPSISGKTVGTSSNLRIDWRMPANTAITYDMTLVQLEVGTTATDFEHRPYDMELQRCMRYYEIYNQRAYGLWTSAAELRVFPVFKVRKRSDFVVRLLTTSPYAEYPNIAGVTGSGSTMVSATTNTLDGTDVRVNGFSGRALAQPAFLERLTLEFDAEL